MRSRRITIQLKSLYMLEHPARCIQEPSPVSIPHRLDCCYILMQPYNPLIERGETFNTPLPKDAPYFFDLDIEYRHLKTVEKLVNGIRVQILTQVLNDEIWVAECLYTLENTLDEPVIPLRQAINSALR